jgi:hypothetical protein
LKNLTLISTLFGAQSATTAYSQNTVFFQQTDRAGGNSVGIGALTISQAGSNRIGSSATPSLVVGALYEFTINQDGDDNSADVAIYGLDTNTSGIFRANFDGNLNTFEFKLGVPEVNLRYVNPDIRVDVVGSGNKLDNILSNGTGTSALIYNGKIHGDDNIFTTRSIPGLGTVALGYGISGSRNEVAIDLGSYGSARDVAVSVVGSDNNWTIDSKAVGSKFDLSQSGSEITGTIVQSGGAFPSMIMSLNKTGSGAFIVNTFATTFRNQADINLVALGHGSFTLVQTGENSIYEARHVIAAGGTATINQ